MRRQRALARPDDRIDGGAMSGLSHDRKVVVIVAQQHASAAGPQQQCSCIRRKHRLSRAASALDT
jgi:hypothetical protein